MGRILAIDYGIKRVGIAVTDPGQLLASPFKTIETTHALDFVKEYCTSEEVETIVVGLPLKLTGKSTDATRGAIAFGRSLSKAIPGTQIEFEEEQYSSKKAVAAMVAGGMKKKDRRKKGNIDKISAAIILQSYLGHS